MNHLETRAEAPIAFVDALVRRIESGGKSQTRRAGRLPSPEWRYEGVVRGKHRFMLGAEHIDTTCPYDAPRLYVRQTVAFDRAWDATELSGVPAGERVYYRSDGAVSGRRGKWRPSTHMPRWARRLTLAVTLIRVERLQNITEEDAMAEGCEDTRKRVIACESMPPNMMMLVNGGAVLGDEATVTIGRTARDNFRALWDSIYAKRPGCAWADSPFVWVVSFVPEVRR